MTPKERTADKSVHSYLWQGFVPSLLNVAQYCAGVSKAQVEVVLVGTRVAGRFWGVEGTAEIFFLTPATIKGAFVG